MLKSYLGQPDILKKLNWKFFLLRKLISSLCDCSSVALLAAGYRAPGCKQRVLIKMQLKEIISSVSFDVTVCTNNNPEAAFSYGNALILFPIVGHVLHFCLQGPYRGVVIFLVPVSRLTQHFRRCLN